MHSPFKFQWFKTWFIINFQPKFTETGKLEIIIASVGSYERFIDSK